MRVLAILCITAMLAACGEPTDTAGARAARRAERVKKAQEKLGAGPESRTYSVSGGRLVVLDIPVADRSGFMESQRCFVWQGDAGQAAISCPAPPDIAGD